MCILITLNLKVMWIFESCQFKGGFSCEKAIFNHHLSIKDLMLIEIVFGKCKFKEVDFINIKCEDRFYSFMILCVSEYF